MVMAMDGAPSLEVILRTHSTSDVHPGERVVGSGISKLEVIKRSARSLALSLANAQRRGFSIRLAILDDHSSEETVTFLHSLASKLPFPTEVISIVESGNVASLAACFAHGLKSTADLLYFVEDDYIHIPSAIEEMLESHQLFSQHLGGKEVALFPTDDPSF